MANRIQLRRDTTANWNSVDPVLADGEPGYDIVTNELRIGNGSNTWSQLSANTISGGGGVPTDIYNSVGSATVGSSGQTWQFSGSDGVLTLPRNSYLETSDANLKIGSPGNVTIRSNASTVGGTHTWTFDTSGNLTLPTNGEVILSGTNSILSAGGTTLLGGYSQVTNYYSTLGVKYAGAGTQFGMTLQPTADNTTAIQFLNAAGNSVGNITQTSSTVKFTGDGSGLSNVAIKTTGSWTVTTGSATYSFTVPQTGTYTMWVRGTCDNGIITWNATATVTNNNVPVLGQQYAWVYTGGGTPIDFTDIPHQFVGTANTIVRSDPPVTVPTNRFDFVINNTSGSSQTVYWGYVAQ